MPSIIHCATGPFKHAELLDYGGSVLVMVCYTTGGRDSSGTPLKPWVQCSRRNWHRNRLAEAVQAAGNWVAASPGAPPPKQP